jgi:hypothetical protein
MEFLTSKKIAKFDLVGIREDALRGLYEMRIEKGGE